MLCRSVIWFFCTLVAVAVATDSIDRDSTSGPDTEVTVHHLSTDNLDSSTTESVQEVRPDRAVDLGALLDAGEDATVVLVAGDARLLAHRAVLAVRSPALQRLLQDAAAGEVAVPDVEGPVLRQLVAYLYTLQAPQLPAMAPQLLAAADRYGLPALKADCERQVLARLSVETAAAAAVVAVRHSSDSLRKAAVDYIRDHIFQVMATQGWADAISSHPRAVAEVARLLSESPAGTGTPAPAASRTATTTEPQSVHSSPGQTPASSVSHTSSDSSASSGSTDNCLLCPSAPAESWFFPYHATQPHNDYRGYQTPTTAATTMVAQTITHPDDNISRLRRLSAKEKGERLIEVSKRGAVGELEELLAAGADVAAREKGMRRTALHWAAEKGHVEVAIRLLSAGAPVDATDIFRSTPLHCAADGGSAAMVRLLLAAGANPSRRDATGNTPLHSAAERGHIEAAAALLAAGADVAAKGFNRWTPLEAARRRGQRQVVWLLLQGRRAPEAAEPADPMAFLFEPNTRH